METKARDISILEHIYDYCDEIQKTLSEINFDKQRYENSSVYRNALALCVLQIGELVRIISQEYKETHSEIPWREIIGMRNIIAHAYGTFDYETLWDVVTEDVPNLKKMCEIYLKEN